MFAAPWAFNPNCCLRWKCCGLTVSFAAFFSPKRLPLLSDLPPSHEPLHPVGLGLIKMPCVAGRVWLSLHAHTSTQICIAPPAAAPATRTVGRTRPVKTLRQTTHGDAKLLSIFRRAGVKDLDRFFVNLNILFKLIQGVLR
jgi:hypothetical protein